MTIIEARYIGPFKVPDWGVWFEWSHYERCESYRAEKNFGLWCRQFAGLYEFRQVTL